LTFTGCSSLESICIPASVEIICGRCFAYCKSLKHLTFERHSRLGPIESEIHCGCLSLGTIIVPASGEVYNVSWWSDWYRCPLSPPCFVHFSESSLRRFRQSPAI
jgi:hypothetical protein